MFDSESRYGFLRLPRNHFKSFDSKSAAESHLQAVRDSGRLLADRPARVGNSVATDSWYAEYTTK